MTAVRVAGVRDVPPGTLKHVEAGGKELVLANVGGKVYALEDRCAHMNAPLSMGTLEGTTITCPLHFSRFDVTTGKKISGPVEAKIEGMDKLPPPFLTYMKRLGEIMAPVKTYDNRSFPVKVDGPKILVDV